MPPNETRSRDLPPPPYPPLFEKKKKNQDEEDEGSAVKRSHDSYRPLLDNFNRRISIYQWIKGKVKDDNIGYFA